MKVEFTEDENANALYGGLKKAFCDYLDNDNHIDPITFLNVLIKISIEVGAIVTERNMGETRDIIFSTVNAYLDLIESKK